MMGTEELDLNAGHWVKAACPSQLLLNHVQTVDKQDTGETIVPLCLDKVGQSPQDPTPQESLSDLLGLAAED